MKKFLSLITILVFVFLLTGCTSVQEKEKGKTDAELFKKEYEKLNGKDANEDQQFRKVNLPDENPMVYMTAEEIVDKINDDETFIVYFGYSSCPWCRSIIEQFLKSANDHNVDKIYYVDIKEIRDIKEWKDGKITTTREGSRGYMELIEKLKDVLDDYTIKKDNGEEISAEEKRIYAPNVIVVSKGEAVELEDGISDKLEEPYDKLTDEMKKETYEKFKCIFNCYLNEKTTCTRNMC